MRLPRALAASLVLACALGSSPARAAQPLFNSNFLFNPILGPDYWGWYTAAADLDRDGHAELISAPSGQGLSLAIWSGSADGLLSPPGIHGIQSIGGAFFTTSYVEPADLDGDGWPDLVVTAIDTVYLFRNQQDGSLASPVRLFFGTWGEGTVSVGDLNGDGHADIARSWTYGQPLVQILLGDGQFGFTPGPELATHLEPYSTAIADFDENGVPDLMLGAQDTSTIFFGQGGGAFAAEDVLGNLVLAGDLDGDGHVDLVTTTAVRLGNGDGTFQLPIAHGVDSPVTLADMDADGVPELIGLPVPVFGPSRVITVSRGLAHGLFGPAQPFQRFSDSWGTPTAADFDGDGRVDLAMSAYGQGFTYVMRGLGDGRLESAPWIATTAIPRRIAVGRLDEGASTDLVVAADKIRTWVAQGAGFAPKDSADALPLVDALGVFDANGDGLDDIVASYVNLATWSVWLTQPGGTLGPRVDQAFPASGAVAFGDVDLDGFDDILFGTANGTPQARVYRSNHDGTFTASPALPALATRVFVADMNADGLPDLAGGSPVFGNALRILFATSLGAFAGAPVDYPGLIDYPGAPRLIGRIDSDELPDVVIPSGPTWYRNLGGGSFASQALLDATVGDPGTAADLDGDGDLDLARRTAGGASVNMNNGDGTFEFPRGFGALPGGAPPGVTAAILATDVDGDGHPDLLVGATASVPNVSILINQTGKHALSAPPSGPPVIGQGLALSVRPNPARGRITASLAFEGTSAAALEMFDVRGRRVLSRRLAPGAATRELDLGDAHAFPPGLYFLVARQRDAKATSRLCIVR